ncbi:MAG: hypothetical protein AAFX77_00825 [Pseudomonadota bacterium]
MTHDFFFRWPTQTAEAEATEKTAVSVSISTISTGLMARSDQPFFLS